MKRNLWFILLLIAALSLVALAVACGGGGDDEDDQASFGDDDGDDDVQGDDDATEGSDQDFQDLEDRCRELYTDCGMGSFAEYCSYITDGARSACFLMAAQNFVECLEDVGCFEGAAMDCFLFYEYEIYDCVEGMVE